MFCTGTSVCFCFLQWERLFDPDCFSELTDLRSVDGPFNNAVIDALIVKRCSFAVLMEEKKQHEQEDISSNAVTGFCPICLELCS